MTNRLCRSVALSLLLPIIYSQASWALDFNFNAKAGLDGETLMAIRSFPDLAANALERSARNILPQIDIILEKRLDQFQYILTNTTIDAHCQLVASVVEAKLKLWHTSDEANDFFKDVRDTKMKTLRYDSKPEDFVAVYDDISDAAGLTACMFKKSPYGHGESNAVKSARMYADRSMIWSVAGETGCKQASECVQKLRQQTEDAVKKYGAEDKEISVSTRIKERWQAFKNTSNPLLGPGVVQRLEPNFLQRFDPEPYERQLATLIAIRDSVPVAEATRLMIDAAKSNQAAKAATDNLLKYISWWRNAPITPTEPKMDVHAQFDAALSQAKKVCEDLGEASRIWPRIEQLSDEPLRKEFAELQADYTSRYKGILDLSFIMGPALAYQGPVEIPPCQ